MCACVYVYVFVCIYIYMYMCIYTYVHMSRYVYTYMYVCMYVLRTITPNFGPKWGSMCPILTSKSPSYIIRARGIHV